MCAYLVFTFDWRSLNMHILIISLMVMYRCVSLCLFRIGALVGVLMEGKRMVPCVLNLV